NDSRLALRDADGDLETVRVSQGDVASAPGLIGRRTVELAALGLDLSGEVIDALLCLAVETEPLSLFAVTSLFPIVLPDHERHVASLQGNTDDLAVVRFPGLLDVESEDVSVPSEAFLEIVHRETRRR